jgi:hypothetical protein
VPLAAASRVRYSCARGTARLKRKAVGRRMRQEMPSEVLLRPTLLHRVVMSVCCVAVVAIGVATFASTPRTPWSRILGAFLIAGAIAALLDYSRYRFILQARAVRYWSGFRWHVIELPNPVTVFVPFANVTMLVDSVTDQLLVKIPNDFSPQGEGHSAVCAFYRSVGWLAGGPLRGSEASPN